MREIHTEIEIGAPAELVWEVLVHFEGYREWNPLIIRAYGEARVGARLEIYAEPLFGAGFAFRPTVLKVEPNRELRWHGRLAVPGLFGGEHVFALEPLGPDRALFVQSEVFSGVLAPVLARMLGSYVSRGYEGMNRALKSRAEQMYAGGIPLSAAEPATRISSAIRP